VDSSPPARDLRIVSAAWYARQGWAVLPLDGKVPIGKLVPHGLRDATTDNEMIKTWWKRAPAANIGIVVPDGLVVLDIDGPEGEDSLNKLQLEIGDLPSTVESRIGRRRHLLFEVPTDSEVKNVAAILPGLDLRSAGQDYIVAPPSIHPETEAICTWETSPREMKPAALPSQWLAMLLRYIETSPSKPPRPNTLPRDSGRHRADRHKESRHMTPFNDIPPPRDEDHPRATPTAKEEGASTGDGSSASGSPSGRNGSSPSPHTDPDLEPGERPKIMATGRQLREIVLDARNAILSWNKPPKLFLRGGALTRINQTDEDPALETVTREIAFGILLRTAEWRKLKNTDSDYGGGVEQDARPSKDVATDLVVNPDRRLPQIEAIAKCPLFDADGRLVNTFGYHSRARVWLALGDLTLPSVSSSPTSAELDEARSWFLDELLVDFRFARASDRAHAVAAMLLPFCRRMIDGCTPMHLIEAPSPGTGKGLIAECIGLIAQGRSPAPMTTGGKTDELRKRITAALERGQSIILLDNVDRHLDSGDLASAITANPWSDRILGKTRLVELPNKALWLVTANNPSLSLEIARRCVRIRIEPDRENPWERDGFRHDPLNTWVAENRSILVWSALTLVQAWVAAGRPPASVRLGSFDMWASTLGGILEHVGIEGFLADQHELYEATDRDTVEWSVFVNAWWERYQETPVNSTELHTLAEEHGLLSAVLGDKSPRSQKTRIGRALGRMNGRWFGDRRIERAADTHRKTADYRLARQA